MCFAGIALVAPPPAAGVINDGGGDADPQEGPCPLPAYKDFKLEGNFVVLGIPFAGGPVQIDATTAKIAARQATSTRICDPLVFHIPNFKWSVKDAPGRPAGTTIDNSGTLSPTVNLRGTGSYRIRFTACSNDCRLTFEGKSKTVGPFTRDVKIEAVSEFAPPPETAVLPPPLSPPPRDWFGPRAPPQAFTEGERKSACLGDGGIVDPQWTTAQPAGTEGLYDTVEGEVTKSRVSSKDAFINHDSQDWNWDVKPDPPFAGYVQSPGPKMEMELERGHLPNFARPTAGDRAATTGYWIFDCDHEFRTEIHPAVGVAAQRPRAVRIPNSFHPPGFPKGLGQNVQVPGVVTDVFFTRKSGEITNNCSDTGLHGRPVFVGSFGFPGPCIDEPHPIDRIHRFNVYLPRSPQLAAQRLGLNPPEPPLYVGFARFPTGGPEPTAVPRSDPKSGLSWVEVTVDLTGYQLDTYSYRVFAAWAYPQPGNWGARRWQVRPRSMKVINDAEPDNPGPDIDDGDWRMFFNTNNGVREWRTLGDCNGCIEAGDTVRFPFDGGERGELPDPVLFPGQPIFVHTNGFDDEVQTDDIGTVFLRMDQRAGSYKGYSQGGDGIYHLNFDIREGTPVSRATLTPQAQALLSAYTRRPGSQCLLERAGTSQRGVPRPVCAPLARDPNLTQTWHPDSMVFRGRVTRVPDLELFETKKAEDNSIHGISPNGLRRLLNSKSQEQRGRLLDDIRRELQAVPTSLRGDYDELVATLDKALPKSEVDRALPPGFRKSVRRFPLLRGGS